MNLILFDANEICSFSSSAGVDMILIPADDRRSIHIQRILDLKVGDTFRVGVINKGVGEGTIVRYEAVNPDDISEKNKKRSRRSPLGEGPSGEGCSSIRVKLGELVPDNPSDHEVHLLLCCPRPKVLGRLWSVIAQVGVSSVTLCMASKVEAPYFASHVVTPEFYEAHLQKGLEQAASSCNLPSVFIRKTGLDKLMNPSFLSRFHGYSRVVCHPLPDPLTGRSLSVREVVKDKKVLLAIGPEGGWTEEEITLLRGHDFECGDLGTNRILTTEVALPSAVVMAVEACRSLR